MISIAADEIVVDENAGLYRDPQLTIPGYSILNVLKDKDRNKLMMKPHSLWQ